VIGTDDMDMNQLVYAATKYNKFFVITVDMMNLDVLHHYGYAEHALDLGLTIVDENFGGWSMFPYDVINTCSMQTTTIANKNFLITKMRKILCFTIVQFCRVNDNIIWSTVNVENNVKINIPWPSCNEVGWAEPITYDTKEFVLNIPLFHALCNRNLTGLVGYNELKVYASGYATRRFVLQSTVVANPLVDATIIDVHVVLCMSTMQNLNGVNSKAFELLKMFDNTGPFKELILPILNTLSTACVGYLVNSLQHLKHIYEEIISYGSVVKYAEQYEACGLNRTLLNIRPKLSVNTVQDTNQFVEEMCKHHSISCKHAVGNSTCKCCKRFICVNTEYCDHCHFYTTGIPVAKDEQPKQPVQNVFALEKPINVKEHKQILIEMQPKQGYRSSNLPIEFLSYVEDPIMFIDKNYPNVKNTIVAPFLPMQTTIVPTNVVQVTAIHDQTNSSYNSCGLDAFNSATGLKTTLDEWLHITQTRSDYSVSDIIKVAEAKKTNICIVTSTAVYFSKNIPGYDTFSVIIHANYIRDQGYHYYHGDAKQVLMPSCILLPEPTINVQLVQEIVAKEKKTTKLMRMKLTPEELISILEKAYAKHIRIRESMSDMKRISLIKSGQTWFLSNNSKANHNLKQMFIHIPVEDSHLQFFDLITKDPTMMKTSPMMRETVDINRTECEESSTLRIKLIELLCKSMTITLSNLELGKGTSINVEKDVTITCFGNVGTFVKPDKWKIKTGDYIKIQSKATAIISMVWVQGSNCNVVMQNAGKGTLIADIVSTKSSYASDLINLIKLEKTQNCTLKQLQDKTTLTLASAGFGKSTIIVETCNTGDIIIAATRAAVNSIKLKLGDKNVTAVTVEYYIKTGMKCHNNLFIDEISMLDLPTMYYLYTTVEGAILGYGDLHQIKSIEITNVYGNRPELCCVNFIPHVSKHVTRRFNGQLLTQVKLLEPDLESISDRDVSFDMKELQYLDAQLFIDIVTQFKPDIILSPYNETIKWVNSVKESYPTSTTHGYQGLECPRVLVLLRQEEATWGLNGDANHIYTAITRSTEATFVLVIGSPCGDAKKITDIITSKGSGIAESMQTDIRSGMVGRKFLIKYRAHAELVLQSLRIPITFANIKITQTPHITTIEVNVMFKTVTISIDNNDLLIEGDEMIVEQINVVLQQPMTGIISEEKLITNEIAISRDMFIALYAMASMRIDNSIKLINDDWMNLELNLFGAMTISMKYLHQINCTIISTEDMLHVETLIDGQILNIHGQKINVTGFHKNWIIGAFQRFFVWVVNGLDDYFTYKPVIDGSVFYLNVDTYEVSSNLLDSVKFWQTKNDKISNSKTILKMRNPEDGPVNLQVELLCIIRQYKQIKCVALKVC